MAGERLPSVFQEAFDGGLLIRYNKRKSDFEYAKKGKGCMSKKKRKLSNRNVLHYVIAFSCIIMLVILVMGTYLYRFYYTNMRDDFYENNDLYLSNIVKAHENEIQILKDIATQMELSKNAKFLLDEQPTKSTGLKSQLYQYRSVNQFFDVMYYYYQEDEYLYNHMTSMKLDYFCNTAYCLEDFSSEELKTLLTARQKSILVLPEEQLTGEITHFYDEKDQSAVYIVTIPPSYDSLLIFFVGSSHFDKLLSDEEENLRNRYIIYDGQVAVKRGSYEIEEDQLLAQLEGERVQKQITLGGVSYLMTEKMDSDGFTYVSLQPEEVFAGSLRTHSWGIIVLLILCCIPSLLLILILSRSMLGEVRNISRHLSGVENRDLYSLESIESGIRDLVEQSQSMKEDQLSLRKNRFIRNFVQSRYTALEALRRDAADAQINVSLGCYMVGVLGMRSDSHEEKTFVRILADVEKNSDIDGHGIRLLNSSQYVVVLFGKEEEALYRAFEDILHTGKQCCEEFVAAVSWHHKSLLIGSKAYLEANSAYDSRLLMDNDQIIRFTETGQNESFHSYSDLRNRYMVQLENTIRVGSEQEVEKAIGDLCEKLKQEHVPLLTFRLLYDEILRFLMEQWRGEEKDWNQIYNVFTLSRCLTIEDFTGLLTEACHMLLDTRTDAKNQQSELVRQAILKMHQEYGNPELNMSFLADSLGISPVTLAVEFKNETGISPSDYLAVVRLDRAKELLADTDMLIKDIGGAVGYEDDHVFIRRFKKYTGKTPGQYRKDMRKTE